MAAILAGASGSSIGDFGDCDGRGSLRRCGCGGRGTLARLSFMGLMVLTGCKTIICTAWSPRAPMWSSSISWSSRFRLCWCDTHVRHELAAVQLDGAGICERGNAPEGELARSEGSASRKVCAPLGPVSRNASSLRAASGESRGTRHSSAVVAENCIRADCVVDLGGVLRTSNFNGLR